MNITSQTARALRLSRPRVQPISSISADGVTFVREPAAFRAEVVLQAGELYGGRGAVSMDADRLLRGAGLAAATLPDIPDFRCRMGPGAPPPLAWRGACRRRLLASCAG